MIGVRNVPYAFTPKQLYEKNMQFYESKNYN